MPLDNHSFNLFFIEGWISVFSSHSLRNFSNFFNSKKKCSVDLIIGFEPDIDDIGLIISVEL